MAAGNFGSCRSCLCCSYSKPKVPVKLNRIQLAILIIAFLLAALAVAWVFRSNPMVRPAKVRPKDPQGSGHYLASRGSRPHMGVDLLTRPGQKVYAPFSGTVTRFPYPYASDTSFTGVEIQNKMQKLKAFYVTPAVQKGQNVRAEQLIGYSQDIASKYGKGMMNHIHVELYDSQGNNIDPTNKVT